MLLAPIVFVLQFNRKLRLLYLKSKGVVIGNHTFISPKAYIDAHKGAKVNIGNNCYITRNVVILNHTDTYRGDPEGLWLFKGGGRVLKDVNIGNNVFIGVNSVEMPGVTIGDNAVMGLFLLYYGNKCK